MLPAYIPSPAEGVIHLGPIPLRAYAFCIIIGVIVAVRIAEPRAIARGIRPLAISDVAVWAVPIALLGARIYNVITSPQPYFGKGGDPVAIFEVWKGGLGVPGVLFGVTAGWIWSKRQGLDPYRMADAVGPAIAIGQALGRFGNYFNQELFGKPTTLPWGLKIQPGRLGTVPGAVAYQPTFLYEMLWDVGVFFFCRYCERHFRLKKGQVMCLYVMAYTVGRSWVEYLRIDPANHLFGLRLNDYVSIVAFVGALIVFRRLGKGPDFSFPTVQEIASGTPDAQSPGPVSESMEPVLASVKPGSTTIEPDSPMLGPVPETVQPSPDPEVANP